MRVRMYAEGFQNMVCIAGLHPLTCLDLLRTIGHDDIATLAMRAHASESQIGHGAAHLVRIELLHEVAADGLKDVGGRDKLTRLARAGLTEALADQFTLYLRCLEGRIVHGQLLDLLTREPVAEALLVEGIGLRVDASIVERMLARRLYRLHLMLKHQFERILLKFLLYHI